MTPSSSQPPSFDVAVVSRFEAARRAGTPEPIERFVTPDHPSYLPTLEELIRVELELEWQAAGQAATAAPERPHTPLPRIEDYLRRFPALNEPAILWRLIRVEYRVRHSHGDRPDVSEYRARFGDAARSLDAATAPFPELPDAPELPHTPGLPRIPGYAVLKLLGKGGMGIVYQACDLQLGRTVALKMLRSEAPAPEIVALRLLLAEARGTDVGYKQLLADLNWNGATDRLRKEAQAVAGLKHPGIVEIYHAGEHAGRYYLVLEYCAGGSLADRLARQPIAPAEAAKLVEGLARAAHHAHENGVIHRDLKPGNVLLGIADCRLQKADCSDNSALFNLQSAIPKIADFGLARRVADATVTCSQDRVGTPAYMAPEQAAGRHREVGPGTDVYALGTILYECLTGRPPFMADNHEALYRQIIHQEPVPPRAQQPACPRDLEVICLKCLEKEPARRYASAQALAEDLQRHRDGRPILARPAGAVERAGRWARRHPARAGLMVVTAVLVLGVAVGLGLWEQVRADAALRRARSEGHLAAAKRALEARDLRAAHDELNRSGVLGANNAELADLLPEAQTIRAGVAHREKLHTDVHALEEKRKQALFQLYRRLFVPTGRTKSLEATLQLAREAVVPFFRCGAFVPDPDYEGPQREEIRLACFEMLLLEAEAVRRLASTNAADELHHLERAEQLMPTSKIVHQRKARFWQRRGATDKARRELALAATRTPTALDELLAGQDALQDRKEAVALGHFEAAVRLDKSLFGAHFLRALASARLGHLAEADACLTICAGLHDDFVWTYLLRSFVNAEMARRIADEQRRRRGGTALRPEDLAEEPDSPGRQREAALRTAEEDLDRVTAMERRSPDPAVRYPLHVYRSIVLLQRGKTEDALAELEAARTLDPARVEAYDHLVTVAEKAGRSALLDAAAILKQENEERPKQFVLSRARARALRLLREYEEALRVLDGALRFALAQLDRAAVHADRAFLLYALGRHADAVQACDAALRDNPASSTPWGYKAQALVALGRYAEAREACDRYLAAGKPRAVLYQARAMAGLGLSQAARSKVERDKARETALSDYDRAVALTEDGRKADLLAERGWVRLSAKLVEPALGDFTEALKRDPNHPSALAGKGYVLVHRGDYRAGVELVTRAVYPPGQKPSGWLLLNTARVYALAVDKVRADPKASRGAERDYLLAAVRALDRCLDSLSEEECRKVWHQHIRNQDDWKPIQTSGDFLSLVQKYSPALR